MKILRLLFLLLLFSSAVLADYDYITITGTPSQTINYVNYEIGIYDVNASGVNIDITQLGRMKASGNTGTHTVTIYNTSNVALGSVVLNMTGGMMNQIVWGTLSSPVTITPGQAFYVLSTETGGSEILYGPAGFTFSAPFGAFYPGDRQFGSLHTSYPSSPSTNFGPVNYRFSSPALPGYTKTLVGGHYVYDCLAEQYAVSGAVADSSAGDTINLPINGSATWGALASGVLLNKAVTINGRGTTLTISGSAATFSAGGIINITAGTGARVTGITFQQPASAQTTAIVATTNPGWMVDNCTYNGITAIGVDPGYFIYASVFGLYHSNTINTFTGRDEYVVCRGPSDAWTTALNPGTGNAVFGEDNVITGPGYCDANSNARMTQRFNNLTGASGKLDGHGYSTNTPRFGVRLFEAYMNALTAANGSGNYSAIEMRGGSVYLFFNIATNSGANFTLVDYAYTDGSWDGFLTPFNYLLPFQIGSGQMATANATALVNGKWAQIKTVGNTNWTAIGLANNNVGTSGIVSGPGTGTGDAYIMAGGDRGYVLGNKRAGSVWPIFNGNVNPAAITLYRTQTSNPSATFVGSDVITSNRDYYADAGAAANTGMAMGTAAQMASTSAVGKLGQGFWVTDEGTWNRKFSGTIAASSLANNYWCEIVVLGNTNWQAIGAPAGAVVGTQFRAIGAGSGTGTAKPAQGRMYVSDNTNWILSYEFYPYPHPLRSSGPSVTSASIPTGGNTLSFGLSESCTTGAGGNGGVTVTASGGAVTWTYASGSGSSTYTGNLSRTIQSGESVQFSYTQPGNGIESTATQTDLPSFSDFDVSNGSTVNGGQAPGLRNQAALGAGF